MGKFKPSGCELFKYKQSAEEQARLWRKQGFRAEVNPASKTTQKRSPSLKWAAFKGQKRRRK